MQQARFRKEYYFRSIDRRWREELSAASGRVLVFSPYLTSRTAELVLDCASPSRCEIHTLLSAEAFASGASSIRTLKRLLHLGFRFFQIPDLHAKVIIAGHTFASIGSQNLTSKGVTNREATVAVSRPADVAAIAEFVQPWLARRTPITREVLADLERHIPALARQWRAVRRQATKVEARARETGAHRLRARNAAAVRRGLVVWLGDGEVSRATAQDFIRRTIWWPKHPYRPCRPEGFADRVGGSGGDWRRKLGANTFLVGRAIRRCRQTIESVIAAALGGDTLTYQELLARLRRDVQGAVENSQGEEYNGYYPVDGQNRMNFGVHAIDVDAFVNMFAERLPLSSVLPATRNDREPHSEPRRATDPAKRA
jgi:hypothetical protein